MLFPVLHAFHILLSAQGNSRSTLLSTQCVSHHRYGVHRRLERLHLELHRHYSIVVIDAFVWILLTYSHRLLTHRLILLLDLLLWVQDKIQKFAFFQRHCSLLEISSQDRQLLLCSRLVAGLQQTFVVGRDGDDRLQGFGEVFDEDVFAEGSIAID